MSHSAARPETGIVDSFHGDHYATLGLDRGCSGIQVRDAYRQLAKRYHPDVNRDDEEARRRTQSLNAAYETLSDPSKRRAYDRGLDRKSRAQAPGRGQKIERNVAQDVRLRIEDFLRGASIEIKVNDPANPAGPETYEVCIPANTAPNTRLRLARTGTFEGGFVLIRLKALPGSRFKVRGSDLRTDLRVSNRKAETGGWEHLMGPVGGQLRVAIPPRVKRGETLTIKGEGMPKPRGGRGDLLVRITYRPEVRVSKIR